MRITKRSRCGAIILVLVSIAVATQRWVPSDECPTIQRGIYAANNGDTVSVWGEEGVPPPYTYNENLICNEKSILIVNRSFLPAGGTGYDSSWNHVVIDGSNQVGSVVTMTGSALARTQKPPFGNPA